MDYTLRIEDIYQKLVNNWDTLKNSSVHSEIEKAKYICIFGTGDWFRYAVKNYYPFTTRRLDFVCDNDEKKWGNYFEGALCISPDELRGYKDEVFVFVAVKNPQPIFDQLKEIGITKMNITTPWCMQHYDESLFHSLEWRNDFKENIFKTLNILEDDFSKETVLHILNTRYSVPPEYENYSDIIVSKGDDYFMNTPITPYLKNEYFVDIGTYTGDTILSFLQTVNSEFEYIYSYELDRNNYSKAVENYSLMEEAIQKKIIIKNIGIGKENGTVKYTSCMEESRVIGDEIIDNSTIFEGEIHSLDYELSKKPVTLIKMDIEGQEVNALRGAEEIIRTQKPKLAICIYHKNADLWQIPFLIKEYNPDYKIYIRHQSCIFATTVCYAIP